MEWTRAHRAQMWALLTQPEGMFPGNTIARHIAKDLVEAGYAAANRKGVVFPTPLGKRAWREGKSL